MPSSLHGEQVQAVLDGARRARGAPGGPFPSPQDWRDHWMYFLMVDRFNNPAAPPRHLPFDDPAFDGYQGGTFAGVVEQLGYLKALGIGAIWLSPVLKNLPYRATYHGYGIHDFLRAEPRFAVDPRRADDELRALVDAAHAQGIYVIFDIVLNHTGDVFSYGCDPAGAPGGPDRGELIPFHPDPQPVAWRGVDGRPDTSLRPIEDVPERSAESYVWPSELQHDRFFRRQGIAQPGGDETVGDFGPLRQLVTADRDLQAVLIRAYQYVIARFDIDGFRIDTLRFLKGDLARQFGNAIREYALSIGKDNFFTFGEVADAQAEQDIARFIGRNTNDGDQIVGVDAALDYPLYASLKSVSKGLAPPAAVAATFALRRTVERDILSSHGDATRFFVTFLDNHDVGERIRYLDPANPHRFDDQVSLGLACLNCLPGIPCLYYGTEQGLHGHGSDESVREALWGGPGFDQSSRFYRTARSLIELRKRAMALRYGRLYLRPVSGDGCHFAIPPYPGGVLAFSRILDDEEVLIVANTDPGQPHQVTAIVDATLNTAGTRFRILYSNKHNPAVAGPVSDVAQATVAEADGSTGSGPLRVVPVTLLPCEVQILSASTRQAVNRC